MLYVRFSYFVYLVLLLSEGSLEGRQLVESPIGRGGSYWLGSTELGSAGGNRLLLLGGEL